MKTTNARLLQMVREGTLCPDCGLSNRSPCGVYMFLCPACGTTWDPSMFSDPTSAKEILEWWDVLYREDAGLRKIHANLAKEG